MTLFERILKKLGLPGMDANEPMVRLPLMGPGAIAGGKGEREDLRDFVADADVAWMQQDPLRARKVIRVVAVLLVLAIVWAAFAEVDQRTRGEGKVIPSRHLQVIQSMDGGIVTEIQVQEGAEVKEGDILLRLDETRFVSSLRENRAQYFSLLAKAARLRALADGKPFVAPSEVQKEDPALVDAERSLYLSRQSEMDASVAIARQQLAQRSQELNEVTARRHQAAQSYDLTARELELTRPLIASGAVSDVDLLRLERDAARFRGERDMASAQIQRLHAAINEAQRKIQEVELEFRNHAKSELADVTAKLNTLSEGSVGLSDRVKQTVIRSPVKGTVQRLLVKTVGGVVQPGRDIIEIVPSEDTLLLEARVHPKDIAFLHPGQPALVRFTAYDFAIYGGLEAKLEHISADTVTDDKGNAFYVVRVRTNKSRLGPNLPIIAGMVADVDIMTGKRTVLSYLLKPILRARHYALSER